MAVSSMCLTFERRRQRCHILDQAYAMATSRLKMQDWKVMDTPSCSYFVPQMGVLNIVTSVSVCLSRPLA